MFIIMYVREGNFSEKTLFSQEERLVKNIIEDSSSCLLLMLVFRINSFSMIIEKIGPLIKTRMVYSFVYFSLGIVTFRTSASLIPF